MKKNTKKKLLIFPLIFLGERKPVEKISPNRNFCSEEKLWSGGGCTIRQN